MDSKNGATEVSAYAREAMGWAVDTGLIAGVNGTDLEPGGRRMARLDGRDGEALFELLARMSFSFGRPRGA